MGCIKPKFFIPSDFLVCFAKLAAGPIMFTISKVNPGKMCMNLTRVGSNAKCTPVYILFLQKNMFVILCEKNWLVCYVACSCCLLRLTDLLAKKGGCVIHAEKKGCEIKNYCRNNGIAKIGDSGNKLAVMVYGWYAWFDLGNLIKTCLGWFILGVESLHSNWSEHTRSQ